MSRARPSPGAAESVGRVYTKIPRVEPALLRLLADCSSAEVFDGLAPGEGRLCPSSLRALFAGQRICGQAITVGAPGDGLMAHYALYVAQPGDVVVIAGDADGPASWGGNMAYEARRRGLAGVVCAGAVRDAAFMRELGLPVWAQATTCAPSPKRGLGSVNVPISIGGTAIDPGDIIVADDDGILVFPASQIMATSQRVDEKRVFETEVRKRIQSGERLFSIGNFSALSRQLKLAIVDDVYSHDNDCGESHLVSET